MFNTNPWNRFRYTLWAPGYDLVASAFSQYRRRSVDLAELKAGERVLIVGCGTGLDLPHLPKDVSCTAVDLTPAMVGRTQRRAQALGLAVDAQVMDGQQLLFPDASFDVVLLHLILAVIPDPARCICEARRVLRPGGRAMVLDKFAPEDRPLRLWRRLLNPLANFLATDITRQLGPLARLSGFHLERRESIGPAGFFTIAVLRQ